MGLGVQMRSPPPDVSGPHCPQPQGGGGAARGSLSWSGGRQESPVLTSKRAFTSTLSVPHWCLSAWTEATAGGGRGSGGRLTRGWQEIKSNSVNPWISSCKGDWEGEVEAPRDI